MVSTAMHSTGGAPVELPSLVVATGAPVEPSPDPVPVPVEASPELVGVAPVEDALLVLAGAAVLEELPAASSQAGFVLRQPVTSRHPESKRHIGQLCQRSVAPALRLKAFQALCAQLPIIIASVL
jgi:hypothetical protein